MSEEEWADAPTMPPKKKGFPGWLMFCGGGCLIALILGGIGGYFVFGEIKKAMDPEEQWARLEESFELDARPPELQPMFGFSLGLDFWMFMDERGYIAVIYDFGEAEAEGRDELFSEDFEGGGISGLNKIENPEVSQVSVQGRAIDVVRFENKGGFSMGGSEQMSGQGPACFVDITPDDDPGFKMLFLMRDPSKGAKKEPISDQAIQDFLAPFLIGPDRSVYVSEGMDYSNDDEPVEMIEASDETDSSEENDE